MTYEIPKHGFGYRGVRLTPEPGKTLRGEVTRILYRLDLDDPALRPAREK